MAESLPALRVQLQEWTDEQRRAERDLEKLERQNGRARWGLLIGLIAAVIGLVFGLLIIMVIGGLLVLAALLATISSGSKKRQEEANLTNINSHIRGLRYKIADLESAA